MGLLDLVEKHDGVGLAAYLLGELAGLVISDIARRRADDARYAEFFHEFGHIEPYQRLGRVEQVGCQPFHKLRFTDAGAADEDKARGLALGLEADAAALYG